jgi:hypothetical protein
MIRTLRSLIFAATTLLAAVEPPQPGDELWSLRLSEHALGLADAPGPDNDRDALLWLPSATGPLRGLVLGRRLGLELQVLTDPALRAACRDEGFAIIFVRGLLSSTFFYWQDHNPDSQRLERLLQAAATASCRHELATAPWLTLGHSTAGIFARNIAAWRPERSLGVLHLKSGNFRQKSAAPPEPGWRGVPLLAINGQFESFGPQGGLRKEWGRETQWRAAVADLLALHAADAGMLGGLAVHAGDDHFHGGPELGLVAAAFLRDLVRLRDPRPGVPLPAVAASAGWLMDARLDTPRHAAAPWASYAGARTEALWYPGEATVRAVQRLQGNLVAHQCLEQPTAAWLDEDDGWRFRITTRFLELMPDRYGGAVAGRGTGVGEGPIRYRVPSDLGVVATGDDSFRVVALAPERKDLPIGAWHPGDQILRPTARWGSLALPRINEGPTQTLGFPPLPPLRVGQGVTPGATSSAGVEPHLTVDWGPALLRGGRLWATRADLPAQVRVTAWQVGRRREPLLRPALPVSVVVPIDGR